MNDTTKNAGAKSGTKLVQRPAHTCRGLVKLLVAGQYVVKCACGKVVPS